MTGPSVTFFDIYRHLPKISLDNFLRQGTHWKIRCGRLQKQHGHLWPFRDKLLIFAAAWRLEDGFNPNFLLIFYYLKWTVHGEQKTWKTTIWQMAQMAQRGRPWTPRRSDKAKLRGTYLRHLSHMLPVVLSDGHNFPGTDGCCGFRWHKLWITLPASRSQRKSPWRSLEQL